VPRRNDACLRRGDQHRAQQVCARGGSLHLRLRRSPGGLFKALGREVRVKQPDQQLDGVPRVAPCERLPKREAGERRRELVRGRHRGAPDEQGDDADVPTECCRDLQPHGVAWIVQPPTTLRVHEPLRPDHDDHVVRRANRTLDLLQPGAGRDRVRRLDDSCAEALAQPGVEQLGVGPGVCAPVADEDHGLTICSRRICRAGRVGATGSATPLGAPFPGTSSWRSPGTRSGGPPPHRLQSR
jgi:hypothetical protein